MLKNEKNAKINNNNNNKQKSSKKIVSINQYSFLTINIKIKQTKKERRQVKNSLKQFIFLHLLIDRSKQ